MGYARHIGRVGALAVTLEVGVAIATTPGIAYADPSGSSSSRAILRRHQAILHRRISTASLRRRLCPRRQSSS